MTTQQADHEPKQGWKPDLSDNDKKLAAVEAAFHYRGDISLTMQDGRIITGYLFDRVIRSNHSDSIIRMVLNGSTKKTDIPLREVRELTFSGRDTAAGKSWEHWIKTYTEKKKQGLTAELLPDNLEDDDNSTNTPDTNK